MKKFLVVLTFARTGSNLLTYLLSRLDGFRALYELFHSDFKAVVSEMKKIPEIEQEITSIDVIVSELKKQKHENIASFLMEVVKKIERIPIIKVMPTHLSKQDLENLLTKSHVIFLARNFLDSWTSESIARRIGSWTQSQTDAYKVVFDPIAFIHRSVMVSRFFRFGLAFCLEREIPFLWYDYGDILDPSSFIKKLALDVGHLYGFDQSPKISDVFFRSGIMAKQDTRNMLDKFENPAEVLKWCNQWGLGDLVTCRQTSDFLRVSGMVETIASYYHWSHQVLSPFCKKSYFE